MPRELASGIDALYMSGRGEVSEGLLADLADARARAEVAGEPVSLDLGGAEALVHPMGLRRYRYRISTQHGLIGVSPQSSIPPIRIQPRSEHLHAVGANASAAWFADLAGGFVRGLRLTASRLDVFSDWQGLSLTVDTRDHFVGRARHLRTNEEHGRLTGFEFGRRATNTIAGRIYDKVVDIERTKKDWWLDVWGSAYVPGQQVMRVEFEFGRSGLTEHGVDTVAEALERAPDLYVTAATDWLSERTPTHDTTKARWPVTPAWRAVQRPTFAAHAVSLDRIRDRATAGSLRQTIPCIVGYAASFAAHRDADSLEAILPELVAASHDYEIVSGITFAERVRRKRLRLRLA